MSEFKLINTIKILCLDYIDFDDDDDSLSLDQIIISDNDDEIFALINEIGEEIVYEYLSERIDKIFQDDLFLDVSMTDPEGIRIEIQKVTIDENKIQQYYKKLYQHLTPSQVNDLISTKSKEDIKEIVGSSFQIKGDLLIAEEETAFFDYKIKFNLNTLSDIEKKNQELDQILTSINEALNVKKEDLFQLV